MLVEQLSSSATECKIQSAAKSRRIAARRGKFMERNVLKSLLAITCASRGRATSPFTTPKCLNKFRDYLN